MEISMGFFWKPKKQTERIERDKEIDREVAKISEKRLEKAKMVANDLRELNNLIEKHGVGGIFYVASGGKHK